MTNQSNISLVFALIILLLVGQGGYSLVYLNKVSTQADKLYYHPYAVSNAARDININLISMHRYMKDVALAENYIKIKNASVLVDEHEQQVLKNFDLIFERYLGPQSDIQFPYQAFIDWKIIRDEVITLKMQGDYKEAADITRHKGAEHVNMLNQEVQKLIDFADSKAKLFHSNAVEAEIHAFVVIISLLLIAVLTSIFSSYFAVRHLNAVQHEVIHRMHLIDQNISMAKFDQDGTILEISNHLCRYLGIAKKDAIGTKTNFFINDDADFSQQDNVLEITSTGKIWEGEICRTHNNGSTQWLHSVVHPEFDEKFSVIGYTNIISDITHRKTVEELSITDALTGIHNRRHFDSVLSKEIAIANRNKLPLTFAVVDIDFFKNYNDSYGHPAGDLTLKKVSHFLQRSLRRPNDYVFRLGGEEFGIIFSGLDHEHALSFLDTIRSNVESLNIEHNDSSVSQVLTISIGAHTSQGPNIPNRDILYVKADNALYEAKSKRNRVIAS